MSGYRKFIEEGWEIRSCEVAEIEPKNIYRKGRRNSIARSKSLMAYWGSGVLGIKRKALAEKLGVSSPAVSQWVQQGRTLSDQESINLTC